MVSRHDKLVSEALRKQRNADRKVSRLEHQSIRIRNTAENPHRTPTEIRNMSPAQVRAHIRSLDSFTDRSNQYERGVNNAPIPRGVLRAFEKVQNINNTNVRKVEETVGRLTLPGSDTTVETLLSNRQRLEGQQAMRRAARVLNIDNRTARNFESREALEKAIRDLRDKQTQRYIKSATDKRLNSIRAALTYSGNVDLVDQINELTWSEKLLLLDYSQFGSIAQLNIDSGKYDSTGSIREGYSGDDTPTQDDEELHNDLVNELRWIRKNGSRASTRNNKRAN